jgi:hypothetical protein
MEWTDEPDHILLTLWRAGNSFGKIAAALYEAGYKVNRNAVAGRIDRLRKRAIIVGRKRAKPTVRCKTVRKPKVKNDQQSPAHAAAFAETLQAVEAATTDGVEYMINEQGCKAILDKRGGEFNLPMVCGLSRTCDDEGRESSYCPTHHRLFNSGTSYRRF